MNIENQKIENSENQNSESSANVAQSEKKVKKSKVKKEIDSINFDKVKVEISKGNKSLITKERKITSKKDLYKGTSELGEEEKKKHRGKIRRTLHKFVNDILGKDRSNEEREKSVKLFLKFYKENWKVNDFKIESFTQSQNKADIKDYSEMLKYIQSVLKQIES